MTGKLTAARLAEIDRLKSLERKYHRLLLKHLKANLRASDTYSADGAGDIENLFLELADYGLVEITARQGGRAVMCRLTERGQALMEVDE